MSDKIPGAEKKISAGICGILLGGLGIHKFILGYTKQGIIQIVITICTCGVGSILGLIEGIIYLTKSDEDFVKTTSRTRRAGSKPKLRFSGDAATTLLWGVTGSWLCVTGLWSKSRRRGVSSEPSG